MICYSKRRIIIKIVRLFCHQEWIRYGIREKLINYSINKCKGNNSDFEINYFGYKYKGNLRNYIDRVVYFYGAYEKQELFLSRDILKNNQQPIALDIGANIGQHSLYMSQFCKEVHAFEPYSVVRKKMEEKISDNNIKNIFVHEIGIGEKDEALEFFAPGDNNLGTGSFVNTHDMENNKNIGNLNVVNGDNYIKQLGITRLDLIKIDVEGFEKYVLKGLVNTINNAQPVIVMEYSNSTKKSFKNEGELKSLLPKGYKIYTIISNQAFIVLFNKAKYSFKKFDFDNVDVNLILAPKNIDLLIN